MEDWCAIDRTGKKPLFDNSNEIVMLLGITLKHNQLFLAHFTVFLYPYRFKI